MKGDMKADETISHTVPVAQLPSPFGSWWSQKSTQRSVLQPGPTQ
ncbi:MAG: hypothetical protein M5U28_22695 [Sandaracinaceae bacterium]|nr:hypothetical protein [Sandaracinaceae bacterium]